MQVLRQKRFRPHILREPDMRAMLESAAVARCPRCMRIWEAAAFVKQDGQDRCPNCADRTVSVEYKAATEAAEAAYVAECVAREVVPQLTDVPLADVFPATIRKITDVNGVQVYESAPLRLTKGVAKTLILLGRAFSSADVITASTGITVAVSARTETQTTLSITAGVSMTNGDGYHFIFNDVYYRCIFSVR